MAQEITNLDEVLNNNDVVVVDFWAAWCGPCQMLNPIIENLETTFDGSATIGKVNVDENHELAAKYGVRNIPQVLFFKEGRLAGKLVGLRSESDYAEKIQELL